MRRVIEVDLKERSYPIIIGSGNFASALESLGKKINGLRGLLVTDRNVDRFYGDALMALCGHQGVHMKRLVVPSRETAKSQKWLFSLYAEALEHGMDRSSFIMALGGGVVGDLAGFAASTYMRGVRFVQVPTTLLAMVDSSVGGKTAINLPQGKNLVGSFYQPAQVTVNLDALKTLPEREYRTGLAEVVKYGVIFDREFFKYMERHVDGIAARDQDVLAHLVGRCCEIKAEVVRFDERESGLREILNFGHTLAHSIESRHGYGKMRHGEAVAVGMVYAAHLSCIEKQLTQSDCDRIIGLIKRLGLPVHSPVADWNVLHDTMQVDKKTVNGIPRFVLADRIGHVHRGCECSVQSMEQAWERLSS